MQLIGETRFYLAASQFLFFHNSNPPFIYALHLSVFRLCSRIRTESRLKLYNLVITLQKENVKWCNYLYLFFIFLFFFFYHPLYFNFFRFYKDVSMNYIVWNLNFSYEKLAKMTNHLEMYFIYIYIWFIIFLYIFFYIIYIYKINKKIIHRAMNYSSYKFEFLLNTFIIYT